MGEGTYDYGEYMCKKDEPMTDTNKALLPCPFCGGDNLTLISAERDEGYVHCGDCLAQGPFTDQIGGWWKPKDKWNTRALSPNAVVMLREGIEKIKGAVETLKWLALTADAEDRNSTVIRQNCTYIAVEAEAILSQYGEQG
jgi:hypothetical protein